ncbi:hypothetical protein [Comamonas terrae]|uniref:Uncharacterized protein n=1 Tax=Comamonas terrae TaxID=673548 RepID=A0ABW5UQT5_9BURK|nr:hypothetical protein [Comamonas terrae]
MELTSVINVRLVDCPSDMDPSIREKAVSRFSKELVKSFRSEEELRQAYKLFTDASEGGVISKAEVKIAENWSKAFDKARQAGFREIAVEEAYFDVRLQ